MKKIERILLGILIPSAIYVTGLFRNVSYWASQKIKLQDEKSQLINGFIYSEPEFILTKDIMIAGKNYTLNDIRKRIKVIDSNLVNLEREYSKVFYSWFAKEEGK